MMRITTHLLLSVACGCGLYIAGAICWSLIDPTDAGRTLLFTIPLAIAAMVLTALLATFALVGGMAEARPKTAAPAPPLKPSDLSRPPTPHPAASPARSARSVAA